MRYYCKYTKTPPAFGRGSHPLEPLCLHPCQPMAFFFSLVPKGPKASSLPTAPHSQPSSAIYIALTVVFLPRRAKTCPAALFCPQCLRFHFIFEISFFTSCKLSWLSNCFLIWCITESNPPTYSIILWQIIVNFPVHEDHITFGDRDAWWLLSFFPGLNRLKFVSKNQRKI